MSSLIEVGAVLAAAFAALYALSKMLGKLVERWARNDYEEARRAAEQRELARQAEADARIEAEERKQIDVVLERGEMARQTEDLGSLLDDAKAQQRKLERERKP